MSSGLPIGFNILMVLNAVRRAATPPVANEPTEEFTVEDHHELVVPLMEPSVPVESMMVASERMSFAPGVALNMSISKR